MISTFIELMERGLLPDPVIRFGVRRLCGERLQSLRREQKKATRSLMQVHRDKILSGPVAFATKEANQQHYEVPSEFFNLVLGPHRKYSCCFFENEQDTLEHAEKKALEITMSRAELKNGQKVLELGCGWGSLSLAMAAKYPQSKIVAVSNSNSQREFILKTARERNLNNLQVLTRDLSTTEDLGPEYKNFDRIVSVEMFEHLHNYELFFQRIQNWLAPEGKMFVHIFTHRHFPYFFETEGEDNWMGKYFFTGGQMPSRNLLPEFSRHFGLVKQWEWEGTHYQKTSEAWLKNMDANISELREILQPVYGDETDRWIQRWRVFFVSVAELFGYDHGTQWGVSHYLFRRL